MGGWRRVATLLVAPILLLACSRGSSAGGRSEAARGLRSGSFDGVKAGGSSGQTPISSADAVFIDRTENGLVSACMEAKGFPQAGFYAQLSAPPTPPLYLSPAVLRRSGYAVDWSAFAQGFLAPGSSTAEADPTRGMSPRQVAAYGAAFDGGPDATFVQLPDVGGGSTGESTSGCQAEARERLYGSVANFIRFDRAQEAVSRRGLAARLHEDDRYRQAVARWQACMATGGYPLSGQDDYGSAYVARQIQQAVAAGRPRLSDRVIQQVATRDAACQQSSDLSSIRERLLPGAERALSTQLGFSYQEYLTFQHLVLDRAKQVR